MSYDQEEVKKVYYSVGEVASTLGVNCSAVRFWLTEFDLDKEIKRSRHGAHNRMFTHDQVLQLTEIKRLLQDEGYKIWAAKRKLAGVVPLTEEMATVMNPIP